MPLTFFINKCDEELNSKLKKLGLWDSGSHQGGCKTTTVQLPTGESWLDETFWNGYSKPSFKNVDGSSAVMEYETIEEFFNAVKSHFKD